jgi:putative ATP-dependent endonuclease of OLD family
LSNSRFYGAKNIQQGKFGDLIYIPAVSRLDDHTKLTGPSALRDLINSVLKKIMDSSSAYGELRSAFNDNEFGGKLKNEVTGEGYSLSGIETAISQDIQDWGTSFELFVNPVIPDNLVKTLVGHRVHDKALGQTQDPKSYGQGFQRLLIFTLIKLSVPSRPSEVCANRLCLPLDGYFHNKFP